MDSNGSGYGHVSRSCDYGNETSYTFLECLYGGCQVDGHFGIKLSLCLINYAPRHEDVWGKAASRPDRFTLGERAPGTFGKVVEPQRRYGRCEVQKFSHSSSQFSRSGRFIQSYIWQMWAQDDLKTGMRLCMQTKLSDDWRLGATCNTTLRFVDQKTEIHETLKMGYPEGRNFFKTSSFNAWSFEDGRICAGEEMKPFKDMKKEIYDRKIRKQEHRNIWRWDHLINTRWHKNLLNVMTEGLEKMKSWRQYGQEGLGETGVRGLEEAKPGILDCRKEYLKTRTEKIKDWSPRR
jgi:hypothetical protein